MKNNYSVTKNIVSMVVTKSGKDASKHTVLFDIDDLDKISRYNSWKITSDGYCYTVKNKKRILMHRLVLGLKSSKLVGDHIDGDKLNNTRLNLRKATRRQNGKNVTKTFDRKNNKSGYKGVSYHSEYGYYQAVIGVDNKAKWIGKYSTALEAAKAYDEAARAYHGEFAYLNFPRRDLSV